MCVHPDFSSPRSVIFFPSLGEASSAYLASRSLPDFAIRCCAHAHVPSELCAHPNLHPTARPSGIYAAASRCFSSSRPPRPPLAAPHRIVTRLLRLVRLARRTGEDDVRDGVADVSGRHRPGHDVDALHPLPRRGRGAPHRGGVASDGAQADLPAAGVSGDGDAVTSNQSIPLSSPFPGKTIPPCASN